MRPKHFIFLLIFGVIVGTAGWLVQRQRQQSWKNAENTIGQELFAELPINDIVNVKITGKDGSVEFSKQNDNWVVTSSYSYYADFVKIADFLKKLKELKALQNVEIGKEDYGRLELNEPSKKIQTGILVELADKKGKTVGKLVIGKKHMRKAGDSPSPYGGGEWPDGCYILQSETSKVVLVSETFSAISDDHDAWFDKSFVRVDKIKQATAFQGEQKLWSLYRDQEGEPLKLEGDIALDEELATDKVNGIDGALRYPAFNKIADPAIADDTYGFDAEARSFIAQTFDGTIYTFKIGKKSGDGDYPIKLSMTFTEPPPSPAPANEKEEDKVKREEAFKKKVMDARDKFEKESPRYQNWIYIVSSYTVDDMLVGRQDLTKKKAPPPVAPQPPVNNNSPIEDESEDEEYHDHEGAFPPPYPTPLLQPPPPPPSESSINADPTPEPPPPPPLPVAPPMPGDSTASDSQPAVNH